MSRSKTTGKAKNVRHQAPDPWKSGRRRRRARPNDLRKGATPRERSVRRGLVALGVVLFLLALAPEVRHPAAIQLGRSQWLLILLAASLTVLGLLGSRRMEAYRSFSVMALNTVIALVVVEIGASAANLLFFESAAPAPVEFGTARANPFFIDKPWADEFWVEQQEAQGRAENYHPYVIWQSAPYEGRFVRVDESGFRHTVGSTCSDADFRVALFGSSALWGWGVPDDATIASFLQAKVRDQGRPICVVNRAQNGWVSTQDLIQLVRMLQAGERIDFAVFFHGFNDAGAIYESGDPGAHYMVEAVTRKMKGEVEQKGLMPLLANTATGQFLRNLLVSNDASSSSGTSSASEAVPELGEPAVVAYMANLDIIRGIAERAGFDVEFFWQPYADWGRTPDERLEVPDAGSFDGRQALIHELYVAVRDRSVDYPDLHFLADDFVDTEPSDWLDWVHLAPPGNERVADLILDQLTDRLPQE